MRHDPPFFPGPWRNESEHNATAPNGEVAPPGWEVLLPGATKREVIAALVLPAIASWPDGPSPQKGETYAQAAAKVAVDYADALIEALRK